MADDSLKFGLSLDVDMSEISKEWEKKQKEIQRIIDQSAFKIKIDGVEGLEKIKKQLEKISELQQNFSKPLTGAQATREAFKHRERMIAATAQGALVEQRYRTEQERTAATAALRERRELALARAQERGVTATNAQTAAYRTQSGVLNGLKQFMNSYISLLGGYRLLSNIKQITSEFELQRVSLRAITQDAEFADALFAKIKATAVESPFSTKDLVTYTKQLAAYRIENEELYGTMTMLADVSAGLGVSMDRLILAYGQVKAASVLRGTELRQFTEAGIPLVDELAKKFSQLRGEVVSTGKVFDLISQREISFEMVAEIFKEMTAEGGYFYEMQKKQSESLFGVYANLKDNIQNAYDEIGQSNRGILMGVGKILTYLAQNLHGISSLLTPLVAGFGAWHLGLKLVSNESSKMAISNTLLLKTERELSRASGARIAFLRQYSKLMAQATAANNRHAIATLRAAAANKGLVRTFYLLKAAMLSNPITAVITGITTLGAAIYAVIKYESPFTKMMNSVNNATNELSSNAEASGVALDKLLGRLKQASQGSQEYADIISEINRRYGEFLPEQLKVSQSYDKIAESVKGVKTALMEEARAKAYSAGITQIETHFADTMKDEYEKIFKSLTSQGLFESIPSFSFNQKEAQDIISKTLSKIKENPNIAKEGRKAGSLLIEAIEETLSEKGIDMNVGFEDAVESMGSSFKKIAESYSSLDAALEQHFGMIDALFAQPYTKEVDTINEKYKSLENTIKSKSFADDKEGKSVKRKEELLKNEEARLRELIKTYQKYEQFDLARKTQEQLNKLLNIGEGWRLAVDKIIGENQKLLKFKYKEDDSIFDYADTLRKAYEKLQKQIDLDLKLTDAQKKKMTDEMSTLKELAAAIGLDFKPTKGLKELMKENLDALKSEFSLVEKIYKRYEGLRELMSDSMAKGKVQSIYKGLTTIDFLSPEEMKKRLTSLLKKAQALGKDGRDLAIQIELAIQDFDTTVLKQKLERALAQISSEIEQQQKASELFERLLGWTGNTELATQLTLGVTGVTLSDAGIGGLFSQKVAEILAQEPVAAAVPVDFLIDGKWDVASIQNAIQQGRITVAQIQEVVDNLRALGKKDLAQTLEESLKQLSDYSGNAISQMLEVMDKYSGIEQKRFDITNDANNQIKKINEGLVESAKTEDEATMNALRARAVQAIKGIEAARDLELFKLSKGYIDFFTSIYSMTVKSATSMKNAIRDNLYKAFQEGGISADQLRRELKALDTQYAKLSESNSRFLAFSEKGFDGLIDKTKEMADNLSDVGNKISKLQADEISEDDKSYIDEMLKKFQPELNGTKVSSYEQLFEAFAGDTEKMGKFLSDAGVNMTTGAQGFSGALMIVDKIIKDVHATITGIQGLIDQLNEVRSEENKVGDWFKYISDFDKYAFSGWEKFKSGDVIGAIFDTISSIVSIFNNVQRDKVARLNKEIERQADIIRDLEHAYSLLEEKQEQLVGSDWVRNQLYQLTNIQRRITAVNAQLEAERAKGKSSEKDAIQDYEDTLLDLKAQAREAKQAIIEEMAGTDLASAAKDFAQTWLDAYLSFDDTMSALKGSFKDMMSSLVQNSMMAKLVQERLEPVFEAIDKAYEDAELTPAEWQSIMDMGNRAIEYIDEDLTHLAEMLNLRSQLGTQNTSDLTGIAKGVAQASEETVLTLAGYANSILYYQIWLKNDVAAIRAILEGKVAAVSPAASTGEGFNVGQLIGLQQQSLTQLQAINLNTGRSADSLARLEDKIDSVISAQGTSSRKVLNTRLSN